MLTNTKHSWLLKQSSLSAMIQLNPKKKSSSLPHLWTISAFSCVSESLVSCGPPWLGFSDPSGWTWYSAWSEEQDANNYDKWFSWAPIMLFRGLCFPSVRGATWGQKQPANLPVCSLARCLGTEQTIPKVHWTSWNPPPFKSSDAKETLSTPRKVGFLCLQPSWALLFALGYPTTWLTFFLETFLTPLGILLGQGPPFSQLKLSWHYAYL